MCVGEISDTEVTDEELVISAICFEKTKLVCVSHELGSSTDSQQLGRLLTNKLSKQDLKHVFVLSDGLNINGSSLVTGLMEELPKDIAITGGLAGDGNRFQKTLVGLNELWYKDSEKEPFHFFNDNNEWKQVDKVGHFYSAFYFSYGTSKALTWCGLPQQKANLWGALTGFLVLVPIEVLDGFSADYGASVGDLAADAAGSAFFLGQSALWNEIRIQPKFSFRRTSYAPLRPEVLGDGLATELFKDYNRLLE